MKWPVGLGALLADHGTDSNLISDFQKYCF
jgi:hypothetical protein